MEVNDLFSRRYGYDKPETLWEEGLPKDLYNGISGILKTFLSEQPSKEPSFPLCYAEICLRLGWSLSEALSCLSFCQRVERRPWHETLSSLELVAGYLMKHSSRLHANFLRRINYLFELKNVNWCLNNEGRFVKRIENIAVIENALRPEIDKFDPGREHLKKAWVLFNKRPDPDYANSIKEAIAAVESAAKIKTSSDKADLGRALDKLDLHPALKQGIEKLYGYASDEPGVRHGGTQSSDVDQAEAELMITICASVMVFLAREYKARTTEGAG